MSVQGIDREKMPAQAPQWTEFLSCQVQYQLQKSSLYKLCMMSYQHVNNIQFAQMDFEDKNVLFNHLDSWG